MKLCPLEASDDCHLPWAPILISSTMLPFLYLLCQFDQNVLEHSVRVYHHLLNLVHALESREPAELERRMSNSYQLIGWACTFVVLEGGVWERV